MAFIRRQLQNVPASALDVSSSLAALVVHSVDENGNYVSPGAGSTQLSIKEILTSSGASVMDSTNNAIGVTIRAGSAGGTEYTDGDVDATVSGGALLFDNSSNTMRPVTLSRGLPVNIVAGAAGSTQVSVKEIQTSSGASVMDSTNTAIRVNVVAGAAGGSTEVTVRQSTAADLQVTATQASTVWAVQLSNYSTTVQVSSLAGKVTVDQNSTVWQAQVSSLAGRVLTDQNSTVWFTQAAIRDGAGNFIDSAVSGPSSGARGVVVRQVIRPLLSTSILITSTNSTALYDLVSSAGSAQEHRVYAYFVSSTHTVPSTLVFMSSNSIDRWHVGFGSGSSGMTGANMAVSPPSWIFATDPANALRVRIEGGSSAASTVIARISVGYFTEA